MQSRTWISVLRRIPEELHESLMIVTSIGTEICIQTIVRMEPEYLVIRGRLAGNVEVGRVFFIPFNNISHIRLQKEMKEPDIQAFFRAPAIGAASSVPNSSDSTPDSTQALGQTSRPSGNTTTTARREAILQRLRERGQPVAEAKPDNA
jgi:hypothetical protein